MKKILLITTGGTIASIKTDNGLVPGLDGNQLIDEDYKYIIIRKKV